MKPSQWIVAAVVLAACNTTSGGVISYLPVEIGGAARDAGGPLFFTTQQGWQVELDQSVLAAGPFYFNVAPPNVQTAQSGVVIIQMTSQQFVDTLDPTLYPVDGGANGETGTAVSVAVDLFPPGCSGGGSSGDDLCDPEETPVTAYESLISEPPLFLLESLDFAGHSSAFVAGTAQTTIDGDSLVIPFYGFITIDESTGGNPNDPAAAPLLSLQQVAGASVCENNLPTDGGCDLVFTTEPSVLQVRIDPTHWFDAVDFSTLIPPAPVCGDGGIGDGGASDGGCDAGPGWLPDAGALTWNASGPDSVINTQLVEQGLQASDGVYFFSVVPQGSN